MRITFLAFQFLFFAQAFSQQQEAYQILFNKGNEALLKHEYDSAITAFYGAWKLDTSNANINFKLGLAYVSSPVNQTKAIPFLEKAVKHLTKRYGEYDYRERRAPYISMFSLAQAYQLNYEFEKAADKYKTYQASLRNKKKKEYVSVFITQCYNSKNTTFDIIEAKIENLGKVFNTVYSDYCPVLSADESRMVFTSRRRDGYSNDKDKQGLYYEDVYICYKQSEGRWTKPKLIGININNDFNDAAIGMSPDGARLFCYSSENGGDILESKLEGKTYGIPIAVGSDVNTKYWETHACITADEQTLYFVSNRPGGFGGRDIYRCVKLPNGNWSLATNLGATINTEYDEDAPFIHPDGKTLLFSSNNSKSMGGFDVFYSKKYVEKLTNHREVEKWSAPINMGVPVNTTSDDIFYVLSSDGKRAYFSSDRNGTLGDKDLFMATFKVSITDPLTLMIGYMTFDGTKNVSDDVRISVYDNSTKEMIQEIRPNPVTGKYIMIFNTSDIGSEYTLEYEAAGYATQKEVITVKPGTSYEEIKKEISMKHVNFESKNVKNFVLTGNCVNAENKKINKVKIVVKDMYSVKYYKTYNTLTDSGEYYITLPHGVHYSLSFERDSSLFYCQHLDLTNKINLDSLHQDMILSDMSNDNSMFLRNVFFDARTGYIKEESYPELLKLYDLLAANPKLKVEISANGAYSSEAVAGQTQKMIEYLATNKKPYYVNKILFKGIERNRMFAKTPPVPLSQQMDYLDIAGHKNFENNPIVTVHIIGGGKIKPTKQ